jgi:antitoxin (DNA-binding transcriptional repressor) of toxin-antitoxin stability system
VIRLAELVDLRGQEETITMTELRAKPGEVISQVELGKRFVVTRAGKVLAIIAPPPAPESKP